MQHIFEFVAIKKLGEEDEKFNKNPDNIEKKTPEVINRFFNTESSRKTKVTKEIYQNLKKEPFNVKEAEKDLESFLLRQIR